MPGPAQIEFVLPLSVANGERGSDFVRTRHGLIASINRFCDADFARRLSIIVPAGDVAVARQLAGECAIPIEVIAEEDVIPVEQIGGIPRRGWFVQQFIKLAYAQRCATSYYVTLDADVFLIKPLDETVFRNGLAPAKYEPAELHRGWWEMSAKALQFPLTAMEFDAKRAFGVTPAFLDAGVVRELISRLDEIAAHNNEQDWVNYLCNRTDIQNSCWTEYSLYWTMLINRHDPAKFYYPHDLYLYSYYTWHVWQTISDRTMSYRQLFCIIQSSQVSDADYAQLVSQFLLLIT
jgi:hypothetical protein